MKFIDRPYDDNTYYDYAISYCSMSPICDVWSISAVFHFGARFKSDDCDVIIHDTDDYLLLKSSGCYFIYLPNINDTIPTNDVVSAINQYKSLMEF